MTKPVVSIIIPIFNDDPYLRRSLDSCIAQTNSNIEIICVDDASTDTSVSIVKSYQKKDSRIRLIEQPENLSALQARRAGIEAANADYILFVDGDDEIKPRTIELCIDKATSCKADVVGFGVDIIDTNGEHNVAFESSMQPPAHELHGVKIIKTLFAPNTPAQGQIWKYLFHKSLLKKAYKNIANNKTAYRVNDMPITFLAIAYAQKYVSLNDRLYTYYFRIGESGHKNINHERFTFYVSAIDSIEMIRSDVYAIKVSANDIQRCYESARLFVISIILKYFTNSLTPEYKKDSLVYLLKKIGVSDIGLAAITFAPKVLSVVRESLPEDTSVEDKDLLVYYQKLASNKVTRSSIHTKARKLMGRAYRKVKSITRKRQN